MPIHSPGRCRHLTVLAIALSAEYATAAVRYRRASLPVRSLDPIQISSIYDFKMVTAIYETLLTYQYLAPGYELRPQLLTHMPEISPDGKTYTFDLRRDVFFADDPAFAGGKGRAVVASDAIYSLKRNLDPLSTGEWLLRGKISGNERPSDKSPRRPPPPSGLVEINSHRFSVTLTQPDPQFLYALAMGQLAIVAREAVEMYGDSFAHHPVGTGPFRLATWDQSRLVLERNPTFRVETFDLVREGYVRDAADELGTESLAGRRLPMVDEVEVSFIDEPHVAWNSFLKGSEIQSVAIPAEFHDQVLASKDPPRLQEEWARKYTLQSSLDFGFLYTGFNMLDPDLGDDRDPEQRERKKALRCALRQGYNWPLQIRRFYSGLGKAYPGFIPPGLDGHDPELSRDSVTYDPAAAKAILAAAGWNADNLPALRVHGVSGVKAKQHFALFRDFLHQFGYPRAKVRQVVYPGFSQFLEAIDQGKHQIFGLAWSLDYPDAENLLQLFYSENRAPGSNVFGYSNPEFDQVYLAARRLPPGPERTLLYRKGQRMIVDDCVLISAYSRTSLALFHRNVHSVARSDVLGNTDKYVDIVTPASSPN